MKPDSPVPRLLITRAIFSVILSLWFECSVLGGPPGDDFGSPIEVSGERWLQTISATNATAEPGEKSHYSVATYNSSGNLTQVPVPPRSIWLSWNAPRSGTAQVLLSRQGPLNQSLKGLQLRPRLVIYLNPTNISSATRVNGTRFGDSPQQLTRFSVTEGANYRFVFSSTEAWDGDYWVALTMNETNAPPNDSFAQAQPLTADQPAAMFSLDHATLEQNEPGFGAFQYLFTWFGNFGRIDDIGGSPRGGSSVWFRWVAPAEGGYSVVTSAPGAIPQLAVWRHKALESQSFTNLTLVKRIENGGNDIQYHTYYPCDQCSPQYSYSSTQWRSETATASVYARAGEQFWLQVDRASKAPTGEAQIFPSIDPYPSGEGWIGWMNALTNHTLGVISITKTANNDSFADALPLVSVQPAKFFNAGATFEPGEPVPAGIPDSWGSFWWTWTAPRTDLFLVENLAADVYRGDSLDRLQLLNSNAVRSSQFFGTFTAVAGETLRIRSLAAPSDNQTVVNPVPKILGRAGNDDFRSAKEAAVQGSYVELSQSSGALSLEPAEPLASAGEVTGSAWFKLPAGNYLKLVVDSNVVRSPGAASSPGQFLSFYEGTDLANLAEVLPEAVTPSGTVFKLPGDRPHFVRLQRDAAHWRSPLSSYLRVLLLNDQFANRVPVQGYTLNLGSYYDGPLLSAEPGEPPHAGQPALRSLWFEWTAFPSGPLLGDFTGPAGSRLAIYRGNELRSLQPVAGAVVTAANQTVRFHLAVTNQEKLQLAVESDTGPGTLIFQRALAQDSLDTTEELQRSATGLFATPASTDAEERLLMPNSPYGVVWNRWTARTTGTCSVELMISGVRPRADLPLPGFAVFGGPDRKNLKSVPVEELKQFVGRRLLQFQAEAGQVFYFGVAPRSESLRYDIGLMGSNSTQGGISLQHHVDPKVPIGFSTNGRFLHRLERSSDLTNWESEEWLDIYGNATVIPADHLYPASNTFLRIVGPQ